MARGLIATAVMMVRRPIAFYSLHLRKKILQANKRPKRWEKAAEALT
jgi:NhaP-type Na+/H+ or K+/H+ antiporter